MRGRIRAEAKRITSDTSEREWKLLFDLLPKIRRKVYMNLRNEEESNVEGKAYGSGDDWSVEASGGGTDGE
jgi:hypothetical protein